MEARYIDALASSARCDAGEFRIAGRNLRPLSLAHSAILDSLDIPLWKNGQPEDNAEFLTVALICSGEGCAGMAEVIALGSMSEEARGQRVSELIGNLDAEAALATWAEYFRTCYGSRPMLRKSESVSVGSKFNAPFEEFIVAYILRKSNGYTRNELFTMPCALVFWIFEGIREQENEVSYIYTEEQKAADDFASTKEEVEKQEKKNAIAAEIFAAVSDQKKRTALLVRLNKGTLPKNWQKAAKKGAKK